MARKIITFTPDLKRFILDALDKSVDAENFIVEKSAPTQRVVTPEGEEVKLDEFGGVRKGSMIFIKSGLVSMIKLSEKLHSPA